MHESANKIPGNKILKHHLLPPIFLFSTKVVVCRKCYVEEEGQRWSEWEKRCCFVLRETKVSNLATGFEKE